MRIIRAIQLIVKLSRSCWNCQIHPMKEPGIQKPLNTNCQVTGHVVLITRTGSSIRSTKIELLS